MAKYIQIIFCGILLNNIIFSTVLADAYYEQEALPDSTSVMTDAHINTVTEVVQPEYTSPVNLIWDEHLSPYVGSELFLSATRTFALFDDQVLPNTEGDTSSSAKFGRFCKFLAESTLASWSMVAQHEFFGHGFRLREFGISKVKYRISPFNGATWFNANKFNQLSPTEQSTVTIAGLEAQYVAANRIRTRWLETGILDTREALVYATNTFGQTLYVLNNYDGSRLNSGHDIREYVLEINKWHGRQVLTNHTLKKKVLLDFLDPFLYYSCYYNAIYVLEGTKSFQYPMIKLGDYQYLPGFRLNFTPFGPEYQFNNYLKTPCRMIQAAFRIGETGKKQSWGISLFATQIINNDQFSLDGKFDIWKQPQLFKVTADMAENKLGAATSVIARYKIAPQIDINAQIGYKTSGYLHGEILKRGVIFRIGFGAYI